MFPFISMLSLKTLEVLKFMGTLVQNGSTHFISPFFFYTPWKCHKTRGLLMFLEGIERDQWPEMGQMIKFRPSPISPIYRNNVSEVDQNYRFKSWKPPWPISQEINMEYLPFNILKIFSSPEKKGVLISGEGGSVKQLKVNKQEEVNGDEGGWKIRHMLLHECKQFLVIMIYLLSPLSWDACVLIRFISCSWSKFNIRGGECNKNILVCIFQKKIGCGRRLFRTRE